ncbi:MAG: RNA 2',3'-cyclic phosphodiesterase [Gemmatimonadetes bacterium]|nr:RNA 2',3'-cyclic phosphodiesterase [Gemmatimonadota bacterium]
MRLFVAINLPTGEPQRILDALEPVRSARLPFRWIAPEAIHLTLQFLGQAEDGVARAVDAALRDVAGRYTSFLIGLRDVGVFPNLRRPGVLWIGVEPCAQLATLQQSVQNALEPLGFEPERRAYHPHITVARAMRNASGSGFAPLGSLVAGVAYESSVAVHSVDLMRSHLSRSGARYERLAAAPLGRRA